MQVLGGRAAGQELHRGEGAVGLRRRELEQGARVDAFSEVLMPRFAHRSDAFATFGRERPDLVDPLGLVDPVDVERRDRQDLGRGLVGVQQDLLRVGRLAEEMPLALPRLEAGGERARPAAQLPGADACGHGRENEEALRPDRQHRRSV